MSTVIDIVVPKALLPKDDPRITDAVYVNYQIHARFDTSGLIAYPTRSDDRTVYFDPQTSTTYEVALSPTDPQRYSFHVIKPVVIVSKVAEHMTLGAVSEGDVVPLRRLKELLGQSNIELNFREWGLFSKDGYVDCYVGRLFQHHPTGLARTCYMTPECVDLLDVGCAGRKVTGEQLAEIYPSVWFDDKGAYDTFGEPLAQFEEPTALRQRWFIANDLVREVNENVPPWTPIRLSELLDSTPLSHWMKFDTYGLYIYQEKTWRWLGASVYHYHDVVEAFESIELYGYNRLKDFPFFDHERQLIDAFDQSVKNRGQMM
jgi:hypothetical protein